MAVVGPELYIIEEMERERERKRGGVEGVLFLLEENRVVMA